MTKEHEKIRKLLLKCVEKELTKKLAEEVADLKYINALKTVRDELREEDGCKIIL